MRDLHLGRKVLAHDVGMPRCRQISPAATPQARRVGLPAGASRSFASRPPRRSGCTRTAAPTAVSPSQDDAAVSSPPPRPAPASLLSAVPLPAEALPELRLPDSPPSLRRRPVLGAVRGPVLRVARHAARRPVCRGRAGGEDCRALVAGRHEPWPVAAASISRQAPEVGGRVHWQPGVSIRTGSSVSMRRGEARGPRAIPCAGPPRPAPHGTCRGAAR